MGDIWRKCCGGVLLLTGAAGVTWSLVVMPSFWTDLQVSSIATHILVGEELKPGTIEPIAVRLDAGSPSGLSYPSLVRARALVALRSAEEALVGKGSPDLERKLSDAETKLRSSLMVDPADAFLWLSLYWVKNEREGFDERNIRYLEQSYKAGPYEGWIALRRNRLALAIFPLLGEQLQQRVVAEFAGMVESEFTDDAARALTGVGWPQKDRLLASLGNVRPIAREALAKKLAYDGVRATVPGVDLPERIWR